MSRYTSKLDGTGRERERDREGEGASRYLTRGRLRERETMREEGKKLKAVSHAKFEENSPDIIINDNVGHEVKDH